jgi:hypothetical protein
VVVSLQLIHGVNKFLCSHYQTFWYTVMNKASNCMFISLYEWYRNQPEDIRHNFLARQDILVQKEITNRQTLSTIQLMIEPVLRKANIDR